jgi:HEAT repeat protein
MSRFIAGMLAGLAVGALAAAAIVNRSPAPRAAPPAPAGPAADGTLERAESEIVRLKARVAELEKAPPPADAPTPPAQPPPAPLEPRFKALVEKGFEALASPDLKSFIDEIKAQGPAGLAFLAARLREGSTSQERFLAAAMLGATEDPAAIPALAEALAKDPDDLVRRMASHAIATKALESGEAPLRAAMNGDKDWGVRVNSAYGLAKLGREDGLRLLESSYGSNETPAEYRLGILGGLADVAAPSTAPLFRRILTDTKDMAYLLMAVNALGKMKDVGSRAELERLAATEGVPQSVREAAKKVVEGLPR